MSELINKLDNRTTIRWKLLASVSAFALAAGLPATASADSDHPILWIEAGMQLDRLSDRQEPFDPPFVATLLENPFTPPAVVQVPPLYSFGEEGKLSFAPEGSDWIFSAAIRFGKTNSGHIAHEQTVHPSGRVIISEPLYNFHHTGYVQPLADRFATTTSRISDNYRILDFQAGRDVGLGAFGSLGSSTFNAGVRFAQFRSRSKARIDTDPDFAFSYAQFTFGRYYSSYFKFPRQIWNLYSGRISASYSFHGIGPSLEWDANATLAGNPTAGAITIDWGVNGSLLFGRQKTVVHHETMAHHRSAFHGTGALPTLYPTIVHDTARSHSVAVPNIGGFAGLSLRYRDAKISLGYRADFFFNAIDGGIDTQKNENRSFYGPFASISIGLGD